MYIVGDDKIINKIIDVKVNLILGIEE